MRLDGYGLKPGVGSMAKAVVAMALAFAALGASAAQYWRGTAENPVWDLTTANWASSSTATTYSQYQNNSTSSQPYFDAGGVADVTVDPAGVLAYVINVTGGDHALSGGPITAQVLDTFGGALTIYNDVALTTNTASIYLGFRPRTSGTVTIGAGGTLSAYIVPFSGSTLDAKLVVLTNGTLKARFSAAQIKDNKFTLYFNGGTLIPLINEDKEFVNSRFLLGPGGLHLQERVASDNCWSHLPGPIGTDEAFPTDGGIWIDQHEGYMLLPNFTCTYRGGVHINSSRGNKGSALVGVRFDRNLGAVPESPTNNIFFLKSGATLVGHGGGGEIRLHPNRSIYIAEDENGFVARLMTWSGLDQSIVVQGTIGCENVENGVVEVRSYSGISDGGVVAFCPTDNRTNHLGRLLVKAPAVIGSGTTLLENTTELSVGTGPNDERWSTNDGCPLNISGSGHLMVTGGVLKAMGNRPICISAKLSVSGSGVADLTGAGAAREVRHGYSDVAITTIRGGGRLMVDRMRMAGDTSSSLDATKSVVNVETGGVLRVTDSIYVTADNKRATLNFNGGMLEWANPNNGRYLEERKEGNVDYKPYTRNGLTLKTSEGGMGVTNSTHFYVGVPVQSGAANDGGITKWGTGTFALMGKCTFNGPLTVMQGSFRLGGSNVLSSNVAVRVNAGAYFIMNTYSQSIARLEGSGKVQSQNLTETLSVTKAIAPGMGPLSLGTLTVDHDICDIADDVALEIDVDEDGNSDCLSYPNTATLDLSKMTLKVNDLAKLDMANKYTIATLPGGIANGRLFKSTNLPDGWSVRYYLSTHELKLVPQKGTKIVVR